jgi:two-component system KDP operon response regulator KdpE
MLRTTLRARRLGVLLASNAVDALRIAVEHPPDAVLLDLGLPDVDGVEVCRRLRKWSNVPIVVLTADGSEERLIEALDAGADDYVTKPFSMAQLLARLRVALRHAEARTSSSSRSLVTIGDLVIDVDGHAATAAGIVLTFSHREFATLVLLAHNVDRVVGLRAITTVARGPDQPLRSQYVRTLVSRVRTTLGEGHERPRLESVSRVGYRLLAPPRGGWRV